MKNRSRPPMVASTFLRTASAVPRFLSRFERGGRGEGVRGTKRDSRKSSGGAIKSSGRDRCSRSASRRTFIDRTMTHSSFRLDDSSTFLEEFISFRRRDLPLYFIRRICDLFFVLSSFFFFFHAVSGTSKMRTSLSSSFHLDGRISPWNNSIVGAENKPYYSSGSG